MRRFGCFSLALLWCVLAVGCWSVRPEIVVPEPGPHFGPDGGLRVVSQWAMTGAGIGFLVAIVLAWCQRLKLAATLAGICGSVLVAAYMLGWVADNLWWICLIIGVLGVLGVSLAAWARRERVESFLGFDVDGDGQVGPVINRAMAEAETKKIVRAKR